MFAPTLTLVNNNPGAGIYTLPQISAMINQSPTAFISYWCYRNPSSVYAFIRANYPGQFAVVGVPTTRVSIDAMHDYLLMQYNALPTNQQAHWLYTLGHSMPANIEAGQINWTTPKAA